MVPGEAATSSWDDEMISLMSGMAIEPSGAGRSAASVNAPAASTSTPVSVVSAAARVIPLAMLLQCVARPADVTQRLIHLAVRTLVRR